LALTQLTINSEFSCSAIRGRRFLESDGFDSILISTNQIANKMRPSNRTKVSKDEAECTPDTDAVPGFLCSAAQLVKDVVSKEEAEVKEQTARTQEIKDDAQKDLDEALPALNSAVEALNALNKNDITEIKSFTKPPPLVQLTMEGVCVLLQVRVSSVGVCNGRLAIILGVSAVYMARVNHMFGEDDIMLRKVVRATVEKKRTVENSEIALEFRRP
jgi:hypothetical protein